MGEEKSPSRRIERHPHPPPQPERLCVTGVGSCKGRAVVHGCTTASTAAGQSLCAASSRNLARCSCGMDNSLPIVQSQGSKFREVLREVQYSEWSFAYIQYETLLPLVSRVGLIRKEKDEAKTFEVRMSSLADAEEALWLAMEQQLDRADSYYRLVVESLQKQHEAVVQEMQKVKRLQEFLISKGQYVLSDGPRSVLGEEHIVDGFFDPLTVAALAAYKQSDITDAPPEASADSLDVIADFCSTIDRVQEFVLINYVILGKVMAHYVKQCGVATQFQERLNKKLPDTLLYKTPGLLDLMYKAEALVAGDVSVGKARCLEGDAWIESRLVHSSIMALAERAGPDGQMPILPFLQHTKGTVEDSGAVTEGLVGGGVVGGVGGVADSPSSRNPLSASAMKRRLIENAMIQGLNSPLAKEASLRRQETINELYRERSQGGEDTAWEGARDAQDTIARGPKIFKVALTGGPCAGKTSSLSAIADYFKGLGWRVYVVREAATVMLSGGINFAFMNGEQIFELQRSIVSLMMCLEDSYERICAKCTSEEKCLIICDRGIMDASVYCDSETWSRVTRSVGLDAVSACDARYSGVVHLVTAADGAEEHYNLDSNAEGVRSETAEQARELDKKTGAAWSSHPALSIIDNSTDFNTKIKRGISAICGIVGEQAPNYALRRRKYLVSSANLRAGGLHVKTSDCDYTYLISSDHKQHRLRRRVQDGTFLYTHIRRVILEDGATMDLKSNIDRTRYLAMLSYQDPERMLIRVVRETFMYKNRQFCLNHVLGMAPTVMGRPSPRAIGNVMLLSVWCEDDIEIDLPPPECLGIEKEVTGLLEYSLFHLSKTSDVAAQSAPSSPIKKPRGASDVLATGARREGDLPAELNLAELNLGS